MKLVSMAWRNIWRNTRRTGVTVGAMALALLAMVLATSMMQGYVANMERRIIEVELGDIQVFAADYRQKPSIYSRIDEPGGLIESLDGIGFKAAPRLLGGALVAARNESAGVSLRGVELASDDRVSTIFGQVNSGQWLASDDPRGVVVGRRLARTLGVKEGDELVILSQATDGSIANDLFYVRGVLATTSDATDRAGVFMNAESFREFFVLPDGAHQLLVRRPPGVELEAATSQVAGLAPDLDVKSWKQLMPTFATIIESTSQMMVMVIFVMYVVIAILILNATLMAVFERVREFGVLKALGVTPGSVAGLILIETAMQTVIALAIGLILSLPALWYLSSFGLDSGALAGAGVAGMTFDSKWYALVTPQSFTTPTTVLLAVVVIGAVYPAIKAARILPVEAMRYQ